MIQSRRLLNIAFLLPLLFAIGQTVQADEKPILVVSISNIDELLGDFGYIAEAVGFPQAGQMGTMMVSQYVEGLDTSKPIGVVVRSIDDEIRPLGILPVSDLDGFLAGMEAQLGEPEDAGNGILELAGPVPVYIKEHAGWAFVAQSTDDLEDLPANPASMFEGMSKKYDIGIQAHIQNIPEEYREMALAQIKEGVEMGLENLDEEDDSEAQRNLIKNSVKQWESLFEGTDTVTLGWNVDSEGKKIFGDASMTAIAGTKVHRQMDLLKEAKSRFTGFSMDSAAVAMNAAYKMLPEDIESTLAMLEPMREEMDSEIDESDDIDDNAKPAIKKLANALADSFMETIKTGTFDTGMSMTFGEAGMNMIAAVNVADGSKLDQSVKEIAAMLEGQAEAPKLKLNADQHAGVKFHSLSIPIPEEKDEARKAFGQTLSVSIGIAKESAYVAVGNQGMELVRKAIDQSGGSPGKSVKPMSMRIALGPIMSFISSMDDDDMIAAIASALEKTKDDQIVAQVKAIDHGADYSFEVREGVLNAIGEGIQVSRAEDTEYE